MFKCDLLPQKLPPPDYVNILIMINRSCVKLKLQTGDIFLHKILELYEMIIVRHGLMLVGYSFGAKSCAYRVLADALSDLFREGLNNENITRYTIPMLLALYHSSSKLRNHMYFFLHESDFLMKASDPRNKQVFMLSINVSIAW